LGILARVPKANRVGLDLKVAKALDTLSRRLSVPVDDLKRRLRQLRRPARLSPARGAVAKAQDAAAPASKPIRAADLDPADRELVQIALNDPAAVPLLIARDVAVDALRDAPLRAILEACYTLHAEGRAATLDLVAMRLEDPAVKALALNLNAPIDPQPVSDGVCPASWDIRLANVLAQVVERRWQDRLRTLEGALKVIDPANQPEEHRALRSEYFRLLNQRPDTKKNAS
jgi:DNA primase